MLQELLRRFLGVPIQDIVAIASPTESAGPWRISWSTGLHGLDIYYELVQVLGSTFSAVNPTPGRGIITQNGTIR